MRNEKKGYILASSQLLEDYGFREPVRHKSGQAWQIRVQPEREPVPRCAGQRLEYVYMSVLGNALAPDFIHYIRDDAAGMASDEAEQRECQGHVYAEARVRDGQVHKQGDFAAARQGRKRIRMKCAIITHLLSGTPPASSISC